MNESTLNLLLQIPLAGVVCFVVVLFLKFLNQLMDRMMKFIGDQAETNRQFLATQREQMNTSIGRMADEVNKLREEIASIRGAPMSRAKDRA